MLVQHMAGSGTDVDVAVRTSPFWDMGCKLSYEFDIAGICRLSVHAGVKNIFNAYQKDFDKGELDIPADSRPPIPVILGHLSYICKGINISFSCYLLSARSGEICVLFCPGKPLQASHC